MQKEVRVKALERVALAEAVAPVQAEEGVALAEVVVAAALVRGQERGVALA